MIAALRHGEISFDYTEVSRPITFTNVKDDLDLCYINDEAPAFIRMWPHQLAWMIRQVGQPVSGEVTTPPRTLWGISLELREDIPEARIILSSAGHDDREPPGWNNKWPYIFSGLEI